MANNLKRASGKNAPLNLSEYAEEAIPFDTVIRKLARVKALDETPIERQKKRMVARKK